MSFQPHYAEPPCQKPGRMFPSTRVLVGVTTFVIALGCIIFVDLFAGAGKFVRGLFW